MSFCWILLNNAGRTAYATKDWDGGGGGGGVGKKNLGR